jgi:iron/zinc/copper transport system permease protein
VVGLYASYYLNISSGAAIVLTATIIFLITFFFAPKHGLVWTKLKSRNIGLEQA